MYNPTNSLAILSLPAIQNASLHPDSVFNFINRIHKASSRQSDPSSGNHLYAFP